MRYLAALLFASSLAGQHSPGTLENPFPPRTASVYWPGDRFDEDITIYMRCEAGKASLPQAVGFQVWGRSQSRDWTFQEPSERDDFRIQWWAGDPSGQQPGLGSIEFQSHKDAFVYGDDVSSSYVGKLRRQIRIPPNPTGQHPAQTALQAAQQGWPMVWKISRQGREWQSAIRPDWNSAMLLCGRHELVSPPGNTLSRLQIETALVAIVRAVYETLAPGQP